MQEESLGWAEWPAGANDECPKSESRNQPESRTARQPNCRLGRGFCLWEGEAPAEPRLDFGGSLMLAPRHLPGITLLGEPAEAPNWKAWLDLSDSLRPLHRHAAATHCISVISSKGPQDQQFAVITIRK